MSDATIGGMRIHWLVEGAPDLPPLVLLNSIGCDLSMWDAAMPALLDRFRVLRIDTRGHGGSEAPPGDYSMATLAGDVASAMDAAGIDRAIVAGVSLGGMIALQLALDAPGRVVAAVPICMGIRFDRTMWDARIGAVRKHGMEAVAAGVMDRFLSTEFRTTHPFESDRVRSMLLGTPPEGYAGAAAAIRDMDLADRLGEVDRPVLVVSGSLDVAAPAEEHGHVVAALVPDGLHRTVRTGHLAPIEDPAAIAAAIGRVGGPNGSVGAAAATLYDAGLHNRRRVLGDEWVDRSLATRTAFNADFQEMITRTAWQEIWGRPGLDERTRRLLVLAITASLGRWEEFALHVRAGLTIGGLTRDELKETLMQTAVYAGVPAANTGFAETARIIAELDRASAD